jgi:hypothetical protein
MDGEGCLACARAGVACDQYMQNILFLIFAPPRYKPTFLPLSSEVVLVGDVRVQAMRPGAACDASGAGHASPSPTPTPPSLIPCPSHVRRPSPQATAAPDPSLPHPTVVCLGFAMSSEPSPSAVRRNLGLGTAAATITLDQPGTAACAPPRGRGLRRSLRHAHSSSACVGDAHPITNTIGRCHASPRLSAVLATRATKWKGQHASVRGITASATRA